MEGQKRKKFQSWDHYLGFCSGFGNQCSTTRNHDQTATKPLGDVRGLKYEHSPTWITQIRLRMRKISENAGERAYGKLKLFLLIFQNGEIEGRNRRREKEHFSQPSGATSPPGRGGRVAHTGAESAPGRGAHGLINGQPMWPTAWAVLSRAPSVLRPVSWASKLRFRIRFRITNRDSLTHDYDYTTLNNGWEIIPESDDEVNTTNENEK